MAKRKQPYADPYKFPGRPAELRPRSDISGAVDFIAESKLRVEKMLTKPRFRSDPGDPNYVDPIFGPASGKRTTAAAPAAGGTPGVLRLPSVAPLPSLDFVNAGQTAEQARLADLSERIKAWAAKPIPTEQGLPPLAAIAAGILGAIAPERAAQLGPEIQRFRQAPIEQFQREHQIEGQRIGVESELVEMQTGADTRQREQLQIQEGVNQVFRNAQTIISGASEAARQLAESDDPLDQQAAKEVMRRVLMLRELVANGMEADPNSLGDRFVASAMGEIQDITALLNDRQGKSAEQTMAMERLKVAHGYRLEEIQKTGEMAMGRSIASATIRAAAISRTAQNVYIKKHADDYLKVAGLMPILDELDELAAGGAGGPIAGIVPFNQAANAVGRKAALLMNEIAFGEAGKAFTANEKEIIMDKIPSRYSTTTQLKSQIAGAREQLTKTLNRLAGLAQLYGYDPTQMQQIGQQIGAAGSLPMTGSAVAMPAGVVPTGMTIDASLFGIEYEEGEEP